MADEISWELRDNTRSCLQLGLEEQCVEKAVETISWLKRYLSFWRTETKKLTSAVAKENGHSSRLKTPSTISAPSPSSCVSFSEPEIKPLVVVGLRTGQAREGRDTADWSNMEDVVRHLMTLIEQLENDRELTVKKWKEEREKVIKMRKSLDQKAGERLRILPILVQQEHQRFTRDIMELKWHISFEGRQLNLIRDEVQLLFVTNQEYQDNLERTSGHLTLLNEKMDKEGDKMAAIIHKQAETDMGLKKSKLELTRTTEKAHQTKVRVDGELKQITRTRQDLEKRLKTTKDGLSVILKEQEELNKKIGSIGSKISHQSMERNTKLQQLESLKNKEDSIEQQVHCLLKRQEELDAETDVLTKENIQLKEKLEDRLSSFDSSETSMNSDEQRLGKELRDTRQRNEDTVCEMEEMKEQIEANHKSYEDTLHAIERAKREVIKIDHQLRMIVSQTDTMRNETRDLNEELRNEELNLGTVEDGLRSEVQTLKHQLQQEHKAKISFQGKLQEDKAELEKIMAEHLKSEKEKNDKAQDLQSRRRQSTHRAALMEYAHQMKYKEEAELRGKLTESREELTQVEATLGGKYSLLIKEKEELDIEVTKKRDHTAVMKDKKALLLDKVEDTSKSDRMLQKMESDTQTEIEKLESKSEDLKDKIEQEKLEEESWKEELKEISEFSRESKEKYTHYVIERERYLEQLRIDEVRAAEKNRMLAKEYEELMDKHTNIKESSLTILEHQLELEGALKDLGQLLALQKKMSSIMTASYKHRSVSGTMDLHRYKHDANNTCRKVAEIRRRLETVLDKMAQFLSECDIEQTEIITARNNISKLSPEQQIHSITGQNNLKENDDYRKSEELSSLAAPLVECTS